MLRIFPVPGMGDLYVDLNGEESLEASDKEKREFRLLPRGFSESLGKVSLTTNTPVHNTVAM